MKKFLLLVLLAVSINVSAQKTVRIINSTIHSVVMQELQSAGPVYGYPRFKSTTPITIASGGNYFMSNTQPTWFPLFSYTGALPIYTWNKFTSAGASPISVASSTLNNATDAAPQVFYSVTLKLGTAAPVTVGVYTYPSSASVVISGITYYFTCTVTGNTTVVTINT
ncbi:hypothetical protein GR160_13235 [Flavobacterium sp. Sd200]|uniref:hypothetical protein n=1 Tax=Flavobacterium sp. Sd200 TaxID=2692211 RepID=UPI00136C8F1D|nr:hypothetical protein [Flavobacterium sp. Sd200]MXN92189.1 hypothetical protein [Flavobacterium sp. Sd200]